MIPSGILGKAKHNAVVFCQCPRCRQHTSINPFTGSFSAGRLVGRLQAKSHRQLEINAVNDIPIGSPVVASHSDLASFLAVPADSNGQASRPKKVAIHPSPSSQRVRNHLQASREVDIIASKLASLPTVQTLAASGLHFDHPPTWLSPPESQISDPQKLGLRAASPQNLSIQGRESWLEGVRRTLKETSRRNGDKSLNLRVTALLEIVEKQFVEILLIKRRAWEEQRMSAWCRKEAFVVDTSKCLFAFSRSLADIDLFRRVHLWVGLCI